MGRNIISPTAGDVPISSDEIIVQRTEQEGVKVLNEETLTVGFDTTVTEIYF